nr:class I SAM-dependent methyltransferase [Bacillota bacterium]
MEKLKSFLESLEDAKILDVGTGRGNFISLIDYLYSGYAKIVGIDILDKMVEIAEKHFEANERIKIVKRDILDTGFPKEHFDLVCLSNSLHH